MAEQRPYCKRVIGVGATPVYLYHSWYHEQCAERMREKYAGQI